MAVLLIALCLSGVVAQPAAAATSVQSGWWTSLPTGGTGGLPALPAAAAPDALPGSLVVQGGTDAHQPLAYAAVSFSLDRDARPSSLSLKVASQGVTTPGATIELCSLTSGFAAASGGPSTNGPTYDCAANVTGGASPDGATYTFDVSQLGRGALLAVAILPTEPANRVVFNAPSADALTVTATGSTATTATTATATTIVTGPPATTGSGTAAIGAATAALGPRGAAAPTAAAASAPTGEAAPAAPRTDPQTAVAATSTTGDVSARAVALLLALLLAIAALWRLAGAVAPSAADDASELAEL